jgi:hypothetical protein
LDVRQHKGQSHEYVLSQSWMSFELTDVCTEVCTKF